MPLGERLRQARERKGVTQEAAAAAAEVHPQQVSKWERNVHAPGGPALTRLAALYGTTVDRLLSEDAQAPQREEDGGIVPVPATTLAYWRGRFDTMAEWAHALDAMMQQQREQFARFTQGVSDFRESGVLSAPPRLAHTADEAEAIVQELREAKARAAGVANGATPASVPAAARKA